MQKKNKSLIAIYEQDETISDRIFMQEINTWEYIDAGIKKTTLIRKFRKNDHNDHFISEVFPYEKQN